MAPSTQSRSAALRALFALTLSAAVAPGAACSGETANPTADAGHGAAGTGGHGGAGGAGGTGGSGGNGGWGGTLVLDASSEPVCRPGEPGAPCSAAITGCPSIEECWGDGSGFQCGCTRCELELGAGECAWSLEGTYLDGGESRVVVAVPNDGGVTELSEVEAEAACGDAQGFYADAIDPYRMVTKLTVRLCPTSCNDHSLEPEARFVLRRGGCPIP